MTDKKLTIERTNISAVIIAGGKGSRLGGMDKGLISIEGVTLIQQIISKITPQLSSILINANRNIEHYQQLGYPVTADTLTGFQGPLAGILTAMSAVSTEYIITLPCDSPNLAHYYVARMAATLLKGKAEIAVAHDGSRSQQMYLLLPVSLKESLSNFLHQDRRAIKHWLQQHTVTTCAFPDCREMFQNINTVEDLANHQANETAD